MYYKLVTKPGTFIVLYCVTMWLTNWSFEMETDRERGIVGTTLHLHAFGLLLAVIFTGLLLIRIWLLVRYLLDRHVRVPKRLSLRGDWRCLFLLVPLLIYYSYHFNYTARDGAEVTGVFEYGSGISVATFFFSIAVIMLYQAWIRLETFIPEADEANPS